MCSGEAGLRATPTARLATPVMTQHRLGNQRVALAFAVFWGSLQVGGGPPHLPQAAGPAVAAYGRQEG